MSDVELRAAENRDAAAMLALLRSVSEEGDMLHDRLGFMPAYVMYRALI